MRTKVNSIDNIKNSQIVNAYYKFHVHRSHIKYNSEQYKIQ